MATKHALDAEHHMTDVGSRYARLVRECGVGRLEDPHRGDNDGSGHDEPDDRVGYGEPQLDRGESDDHAQAHEDVAPSVTRVGDKDLALQPLAYTALIGRDTDVDGKRPLRLMVDLPNEAQIVDILIHTPGRKLLVASDAGNGFIVPEDEVLAQTRNGKQVLNVKDDERAVICKPVEGDHVAVVSQNGKFLVFPASELPEMTRGKGVRLQKYKDGGLSDAMTFALEHGLSWKDPAGRTRTETDLTDWLGKRASAGRMAPRGFPRDNRFT